MRVALTAMFLLILGSAFAKFHPANIASAKYKIAENGTFEMRVRFDFLAFLLDANPGEIADTPMNRLLDGPDSEIQTLIADGKQRFEQSIHIYADDKEFQPTSMAFPTVTDVREYVAANPKQRLPVILTVVLKGSLPRAARSTSARFPDTLSVVVLTTELPYVEPNSEPVAPGTTSTPTQIPQSKQVAAAKESAAAHLNPKPVLPTPTTKISTPTQEQKPPEANPTAVKEQPAETSAAPEISKPSAFLKFITMGFHHILPEGLDHILFVLGLFLLSTKTKDLLKQVTAFTIAHSLTLGLSLYGVFQLPSKIVEPIIALSIAFVAIENIVTKDLKPWRVYVVFGFGLIHGLGFASALHELGLAKNQFLSALVGFNVGVELGQLSVIALAFAAVGWFRNQEKYRTYVVVPASIGIAVVALFWTVQRVI